MRSARRSRNIGKVQQTRVVNTLRGLLTLTRQAPLLPFLPFLNVPPSRLENSAMNKDDLQRVAVQVLGAETLNANEYWTDLHLTAIDDSRARVAGVLEDRSYREQEGELSSSVDRSYGTGMYLLVLSALLDAKEVHQAINSDEGQLAVRFMEEVTSPVDGCDHVSNVRAIIDPWHWINTGLRPINSDDPSRATPLNEILLEQCRRVRFKRNFLLALIATLSVSFDEVLEVSKGLDGFEARLQRLPPEEDTSEEDHRIGEQIGTWNTDKVLKPKGRLDLENREMAMVRNGSATRPQAGSSRTPKS